MKKIKEMIALYKENFAKKTIRQKILFCIGTALILTFTFFLIKGNFFDKHTTQTDVVSQSEETSGENYSDSENTQTSQTQNNTSGFHINWVDIGILLALCTAYGVHKFRTKKRERRF